MMLQNASDAAMCEAFGLTLTRPARQWFRRLRPDSIGSFWELSDAFSVAFVTSKSRRKDKSHLYAIKQGKDESIKDYMERFTKVMLEVKSCADDTLIHACWEGICDKKLLYTLAYDEQATFSQMLTVIWRHTDASEYI